MTGNSDKPKNKMGMLLKNDFLASSRVISLVYIVEIVAFILFLITKGGDHGKVWRISVLLSTVVPFVLILVTLFFVVYDFNKSLYSQQGYLTYSLPVTSNQLLGSKMIVYGFWMSVSFAVAIFMMVYFAAYLEQQAGDTMQMADLFLGMFDLPSVKHIKIYAFYGLAMFFIFAFSLVSILYFAITASHIRLFQKANFVWAIVIFGVVAIMMLIITSIVDSHIFINLLLYDDGTSKIKAGDIMLQNGLSLPLSPLFYYVVQDVILFFVTSLIMRKWINIK